MNYTYINENALEYRTCATKSLGLTKLLKQNIKLSVTENAWNLFSTIQLYCQVSIYSVQYNFIAKCQFIQYNTTLLPSVNLFSTIQLYCQRSVYSVQYNFIAKCQYNCARSVLRCQVHSSHIHTNHKT